MDAAQQRQSGGTYGIYTLVSLYVFNSIACEALNSAESGPTVAQTPCLAIQHQGKQVSRPRPETSLNEIIGP